MEENNVFNGSTQEYGTDFAGEEIGAETPFNTPNAPFKRVKRFGVKAIAIAAAAAVVCLVAVVSACAYFNSPKVVAINSIAGFVEDFIERDELALVNGLMDGGSVEASMSKLESDGESLMGDFSFSGKLYLSDKALMLQNVNVAVGDNKINASLYLSEDLLYVSEKEIIGGSYGIEFDELANDLKRSIFAYGSDSKYAIPSEELYDALISLFEDNDSKEFNDDLAELCRSVTKDVYKIVYENAEIEKENDKVRINGDKVSARVITFTIDQKAMANIVEQLYEYLEDNDDIVSFIEKYEEDIVSYVGKYVFGGDFDESLVELYEDFIDEFGDNVDDICDEIKEEKFKLTVELVTPKMSSDLLKLTVKYDKEELFCLELGAKGIKKTDEIVLTADGTEISYKIKKNTNKEYEAKLTVDKETIFTVEIDKSAEKFTFEFEGVTLSGDVAKSGKVTTISLKKITCDREVVDWDGYYDAFYGSYSTPDISDYTTVEAYTVNTNLKIVVDTGAEMPSAPGSYKTIDKIKESDIDGWIEKIGGN